MGIFKNTLYMFFRYNIHVAYTYNSIGPFHYPQWKGSTGCTKGGGAGGGHLASGF